MAKRLALVVGFGPGVGLGVARGFADSGFQLALLSRHPEKARDEVLALVQAGHTAHAFAADAADAESLRTVIADVRARLGDPEVLIYNAVAFTFGRPTKLTGEQLAADFRVSVAGALTATLAVLPAMQQRGRGTLLFTGGGAALYPWTDAASISIGKAALRNLVFTLADDLKGSGVRVGTLTIMGQVAPGTAFDPGKIGRAFVDLYNQPTENFVTERQFTGT